MKKLIVIALMSIIFLGCAESKHKKALAKAITCSLKNTVSQDNGNSVYFEKVIQAENQDFRCFMDAVNMPDWVKGKVWNSSVTHGQQTVEWDGFEASWVVSIGDWNPRYQSYDHVVWITVRIKE